MSKSAGPPSRRVGIETEQGSLKDKRANAIFNATFARYGGRLPEGRARNALGTSRDHFQHLTGGVFNCDHIANQTFNAIATISEGVPLIGIFAGVWPYLVSYFSTLLSDPDVFNWVGDPTREKFDAVRVAAFRDPFSSPAAFAAAAKPPNCSVRAGAVGLLAYSAYLFIASHEASHITRGHLNVLLDEFGVHAFEELPMSDIEDREALFKRALEFDADSASAVLSLLTWRDLCEIEPPANIKHLGVDRLWLASIQSLFVFLESLQFHAGKERSKTHPPSALRIANVMAILQTSSVFATPIDSSYRLETVDHVSRWFSRNFGDVLFEGSFSDPRGEIMAIRSELAPYAEALSRHTASWVDHLAR